VVLLVVFVVEVEEEEEEEEEVSERSWRLSTASILQIMVQIPPNARTETKQSQTYNHYSFHIFGSNFAIFYVQFDVGTS
jgi:hypothetical protein